MEVTIVSKSGIGTSKAEIRIKLTKKNAAAFCESYLVDTSEACAIKVLRDDGAKLRPFVSGNCRTGTWVDMYGNRYVMRGRNKNTKGNINAEYLIENRKRGEILDGSSASGYSVALGVFKALCPGSLHAKKSEHNSESAERLPYGYKEGAEVKVLSKAGLDSKSAVIKVESGLTLVDRLRGDCIYGTWTDFEGQKYSFEGINQKAQRVPSYDGSGPVPTEYIIRNNASGEVADGSSMSRYDLELKYYQSLCPEKFSSLEKSRRYTDSLRISRDGKGDFAVRPPMSETDAKGDIVASPPIPEPKPIEVMMMSANDMLIQPAAPPPPDVEVSSSSVTANSRGYVIAPDKVTEEPVPSTSSDIEQRLGALESRMAENSKSDRVVCKTALAASGIQWEENPEFKGSVDEALKRSLSVEQCRAILKIGTVLEADGGKVQQSADIEAARIKEVGDKASDASEEERIVSIEEAVSPPYPWVKPSYKASDGVQDEFQDFEMSPIGSESAAETERKPGTTETRSIYLHREATGEKLFITYKKNGVYIPSAMKKINYLLRDLKSGRVEIISSKLVDLMWELHADLNSKQPIRVVSGYIDSNHSIGNSLAGEEAKLHNTGRAIDFYLSDIPISDVEKSAIVRRYGGVQIIQDHASKQAVLHIDVSAERIDEERYNRYVRQFRKTIGARLNNRGMKAVPEIHLAEEGAVNARSKHDTSIPRKVPLETAYLDGDTDADLATSMGQNYTNGERTNPESPKLKHDPTTQQAYSLGCLSYAGQAYACVRIIKKSGLGTRKAIITVKPTLDDAIGACAEVNSPDTPKEENIRCAQENYAEQKRLKSSVYADCKKRTWTDLYGNSFRLLGKNKKTSEFSERYVVIESSTRERVIAMPYYTVTSVFSDLCPSIAPKDW